MDFISAIVYLLKNSHKIFGLALFFGVLTFIGASFIPKTYVTETRLMMVEGEQGSSALSGLSALSGGMDLLGSGAGSVDPLFLECLNAREIRYQMIPLFGFDTLNSDSKPRDLIVADINEDLNIYVDEATFVISVSYEGEDRKQNIEIVKYLVSEAITKYKKLQQERILESTAFLRDKVIVYKDSLNDLNDRYIGTSESRNIIDVGSQVEATALYLSTFEQKLFELKLKKKVTALEYGAKSINVKNIESQISSLSRELRSLKKGKSKAFTFWIDPKKSVSYSVEQASYKTDVLLIGQLLKVAQMELLTTEAELKKKNSVAQVIQEAYYPDYKKGPKRILWVLAALVLVSVIAAIRYVLLGIKQEAIKIDKETRDVLLQLNILK